jgi:WD40 repeat protein
LPFYFNPHQVRSFPGGHLLQTAGKPVSALVFSPDGQLLASGSRDGAVSIWAVASNHLVRTSLVHSGKVAAVAFSPDGSLLASGGQDRSLRVWTLGGQELRKLDGHTNGVSALTFSPDGRTFASGGTDGAIFLWNTGNWTLTRRLLGHPSCIHALCVSANNQFLASGSDEFLRIWNLKDAGYPFDTLRERVKALSYYDLDVASPGDQKPKFHSSDGKGLQLWQPSGVIGTQILAPWVSHIGILFSESKSEPSAVAAEKGLMATGWTNGVVEIWDANGYGTVKLVAHASAVESVALSAGGMLLATGSDDGTVKLWRARELMDQATSEASRKRGENKREK